MPTDRVTQLGFHSIYTYTLDLVDGFIFVAIGLCWDSITSYIVVYITTYVLAIHFKSGTETTNEMSPSLDMTDLDSMYIIIVSQLLLLLILGRQKTDMPRG